MFEKTFERNLKNGRAIYYALEPTERVNLLKSEMKVLNQDGKGFQVERGCKSKDKEAILAVLNFNEAREKESKAILEEARRIKEEAIALDRTNDKLKNGVRNMTIILNGLSEEMANLANTGYDLSLSKDMGYIREVAGRYIMALSYICRENGIEIDKKELRNTYSPKHGSDAFRNLLLYFNSLALKTQQKIQENQDEIYKANNHATDLLQSVPAVRILNNFDARSEEDVFGLIRNNVMLSLNAQAKLHSSEKMDKQKVSAVAKALSREISAEEYAMLKQWSFLSCYDDMFEDAYKPVYRHNWIKSMLDQEACKQRLAYASKVTSLNKESSIQDTQEA